MKARKQQYSNRSAVLDYTTFVFPAGRVLHLHHPFSSATATYGFAENHLLLSMRVVCSAFAVPFFRGAVSCRTRLHANRLCKRPERHFVAGRATRSVPNCRAEVSQLNPEIYQEIENARNEARPYRIDRSKLTNTEWEMIKRRSKAIPMIADPEPLDVIFEDDNFLVVNKPSFLKMHPAHRFEGGSLLNRAIGYLGFTPWLMHRLDMHTTGVVVMTKKKELCKPIMKQFMNGEVEKEYLCVVDGIRDDSMESSFTVDAPIQRHEIKFMREIGATKPYSKMAQTRFTILQKSDRAKMMVLRAAPVTGRTHQIRLHAQECGLPIVGDDLYNPTEHNMYASPEEITLAARDEALVRYGNGNPLRKKLKLHAWKIRFSNPLNGHPISFVAAAPDHMKVLLKWAGMEIPAE